MGNIQSKSFDGREEPTLVENFPDKCPICHRHISPQVWGQGLLDRQSQKLEAAFLCTNPQCRKLFLAYYSHGNPNTAWPLRGLMKGNHQTTEFSEDIKKVSPSFPIIFNQAERAEYDQLSEICGPGYRKALEFLMKDYVIQNNKNDEEKIKKQFLGNTIKDYVKEERIRAVAERAAWLGNDETHYVRKWDTKDVKDLKNIIHLAVLWIQMEIETAKLKAEMPGPK